MEKLERQFVKGWWYLIVQGEKILDKSLNIIAIMTSYIYIVL